MSKFIDREHEMAKKVTWNKSNRKTWYILFSAGGFTSELKDLVKSRNDLILSE
jgi:hypothetical protein